MELQQPPMPTIQSQPSSQVGYTQRPMNARSQTYNRYLDWAVASRATLQSIPTTTLTKITWYTYTITGKYAFDVTIDSVTIPVDGTYQIISSIWFDGDITGDVISYIYLNWAYLDSNFFTNTATFQKIQIVTINNLLRWDILDLRVIQTSGWTNNISTAILSVTKLS